MKNNTKNWLSFELLVYSLFAALSIYVVQYLFYYDPVSYTLLIAEDHIAEYGTSVSFGLAGIILLRLSFIRGSKIRRVMWLLIGVVALVIAAEEISWGQRIFYVGTPSIISEHNLQGELTFHNLAAFDSVHKKLHVIVSYLILLYLIFSLAVLALLPSLGKKLTVIGLPLIQPRLVPVFLLAPYFLIAYPFTRADEVGELFLGIAVLMWAIDLFLVTIDSKRIDSITSVFVMTGMLILVVIISGGLAYRSSSDGKAVYSRGSLLNLIAARDYPNYGMYEQAQGIYAYIYQHPQYLAKETRINHARMLQTIGKEQEAVEILTIAAKDIEAKEPLRTSNSKQLRQLGIIYTLLKNNKRADDYYDRSIIIDQQKISSSLTPDEKAVALLSISQTMQARGNVKAAIASIEQAIKYAHSPALRIRLEEQREKLMTLDAQIIFK